jgi:hypothetical protein
MFFAGRVRPWRHAGSSRSLVYVTDRFTGGLSILERT